MPGSGPKIVVTILQARRVVLPYMFIRHVLPRMRAAFSGSIEVALVQHRTLPRRADGFLETTQHDESWGRRVAEWTQAGRFEGADIVPHDIQVPEYPSIPTLHLACREALRRQADFHLWMEDDALVWDEDCGRWPELFGPAEMGVYRYFSDVNSAFFVTRPSFDARVLPGLADYGRWNRSHRIERYFRQQLRTRRVHLDPAHAVRNHRNRFPFTGPRFVADMVRRLSPEEAHLLDLELGDGASILPSVSHRELMWLWVRDWARPIELGRRLRNEVVERMASPGD
jgi:hypothetical protein